MIMLLMLISSGGGSAHDLVSVVDAADYFQAHNIDVKADALVDLAGKDPEDAKGQVAQLLALRWLGEHAEQARKVKTARTTIQQIADGKKAQDPLGFAKDYAQATLALLDGKPAPKAAAIPANSVAREALRWFPDSASIFGAFDTRASGELAPLDESGVRSFLAKILRGKDKQEFYKFVDGAGNIRLDRVSFGYTPDPQNSHKSRIYMRFTGLADRKALADLLKKTMPDSKVEFKKGPKGLITVISAEKHPPAFALIGNTDLLMCGYEGNEENSLEVLEEALDVQAGNKASILKGTYAARLKKVPADAVGVSMGDVPEQLRRDMVRGPGSPFKAIPKSVFAVMTRAKHINIDWHGTMTDADDAKAFAESVADLKKQGVELLKQLPPQLKIKPEQVKVMTKALQSVRMEAKDDTVSGGLEITQQMVHVINAMIQKSMEWFMLEERSSPAPNPPKAIEKTGDLPAETLPAEKKDK
jgi:hypothetical protein